jgi:prophage antirepressor-like protein
MSNLQNFDFTPGLSIRAIVKDGEPWFVAKDVCSILDFKNASDRLGTVDASDKGLFLTETLGGSQRTNCVNESGLYSLIMRSRKPEAKAFQKWVTSTVLPTLRKGGIYITGQEKPISDDLTLADLLAQMADLQAKVDAIKEGKLRAWSKHQEEKEARRDAFKFLKGRSKPIKCSTPSVRNHSSR